MATINHHLDTVCEQDQVLARGLKKAFYVDDLLTGAETFEERLQVNETSKLILSDAAMLLRKWKTNNRELQNVFDSTEKQVKGVSTELAAVLGMHWCTKHDYFELSSKPAIKYLASTTADTKRTLLKTAARIFDPLGILAPFDATANILFQRLWALQVSWDSRLPSEVAELLKDWCAGLIQLASIQIRRCVRNGLEGAVTSAELHVFVDASLKAYGACAYLKTSDSHGDTVTSLIVAKSRIAPTKRLTLPKLELMGSLVWARVQK